MLPSKNGGPSAFRTPLGWYVVGLFTKLERESSISYNQIIAQGADTRKTSGKVKYINVKHMRFVKFLKLIVEKSRKVGEHFKTPLPMKDRSLKLLNNRNMAEKRFS